MINIIKQLLDWIYRRNCYFCHKPSSTGIMCQTCYEKIELNFPEPTKVVNGVPVYSASLYIDNLKKLIRGLKYHKQKELAKYMAEILYTYWQNTSLTNENIEIIPMPLYKKRQKQRGYNHIELVAEEFSKLTGFPVNKSLVKRIKDTKPQYRLKRVQRLENLKDAFEIDQKAYNKTKLLLLDDICTTGITLGEMIKTLQKNNITDLYAIVGANPISIYER
ncbi:MAG: hypothetical protein ACD_20C00395G0023 [uncultured bacterium]|nr:MAG: hypothetical protein ACD_20C00395G0023 [uncultured bacterium]